MYYYGPLKIGSDSAVMQFDFDTGSDWLWVPTPACTTCGAHSPHTIAAPDVSTGNAGSISYADGSGVSGTVYNSTVTTGSVATT